MFNFKIFLFVFWAAAGREKSNFDNKCLVKFGKYYDLSSNTIFLSKIYLKE